MEFCPTCGRILIIEKEILICNKCNFRKNQESHTSSSEKVKIKKDKAEGIAEGGNPMAGYEHVCGSCGYDKAEALIMGPYYADEDTIIRFKCGKCGHTESSGKRFK